MNDPQSEKIQLKIWPESVRGGPNALLRSALFAGIASKKRKVLGTQVSPLNAPEGVEIIAQGSDRIKYAGVQLNQYDADVFFQALHLARRDPLGTECFFTGSSFLKAIGRSRNDLNYKDLDNSLRRLNQGMVDVEWKARGERYEFTGHLVSSFTRAKDSRLYKVAFAPEIRKLFAPASWTQLEWEERMALPRGLAQWLHSYFSTHAVAYPISVEYLHKLSGSNRMCLKGFGTDLRKATGEIHEQIGWEFIWAGDVVTVTRTPSGAQVRHLSRKSAKAQRKRVDAARNRGALNPAKAALQCSNGELTKLGDIVSDLFNAGRQKR